MKLPVVFEVTAGIKRTQLQHSLSSPQPPAGSSSVHTVIDEMSAGSFNHPGTDREALSQILVVVEEGFVLQEIIGALVNRFTLSVAEATKCCTSTNTASNARLLVQIRASKVAVAPILQILYCPAGKTHELPSIDSSVHARLSRIMVSCIECFWAYC